MRGRHCRTLGPFLSEADSFTSSYRAVRMRKKLQAPSQLLPTLWQCSNKSIDVLTPYCVIGIGWGQKNLQPQWKTFVSLSIHSPFNYLPIFAIDLTVSAWKLQKLRVVNFYCLFTTHIYPIVFYRFIYVYITYLYIYIHIDLESV